MERRSLGRTGESLSVVGFGGIIVMDETSGEAELEAALAEIAEDVAIAWDDGGDA